MSSNFPSISFASDNHSGVHPKVLEWLAKANQGPAAAYGSDSLTLEASQQISLAFGLPLELALEQIFLVWNGTAANVLGLKSLLKPHQAILCSSVAHIHLDECGAPEQWTGSKLVPIPTPNAKLTPDLIRAFLVRKGDTHAVQAKVISISQSTEYGTVYSLAEIKALADFAHEHQLYLHMDGARAANAAVSLGCTLQAMTKAAGVDLLSFGGTKNGLMGAEAIVFFNQPLAQDFKFVRKQGLHLASKMRFLAAQFLAYFADELWFENALHANQMAIHLEKVILGVAKRFPAQVKITQSVDANAVFAILSPTVIPLLQKEFYFYEWNEVTHECRFMCSFETTANQLDQFGQRLEEVLKQTA